MRKDDYEHSHTEEFSPQVIPEKVDRLIWPLLKVRPGSAAKRDCQCTAVATRCDKLGCLRVVHVACVSLHRQKVA